MDLAAVLLAAVDARRAAINATAERWTGRPIKIELTWLPGQGKIDMVVTTIDRLPAWRLEFLGTPPPPNP